MNELGTTSTKDKQSVRRKISIEDVKPGKYFVSKKEIFVREIVENCENDNIYWRDWSLDTGEPIVETLQMCSKRAIVNWAGREATDQEIVGLEHEPLKGDQEISVLHELYAKQKIREFVNKEVSSSIINTGKIYTLFVGINFYSDTNITDLNVCVHDVTALHNVFKDKSEKTLLLSDHTDGLLPNRKNIFTSLSHISRLANENDLILFYFSGHGIAEDGQSYLLPNDVCLPILKYTSLSVKDVKEIMENSRARAKVIIIDACHAGAIIGKSISLMTDDFQKSVFEEAEGFVVLASCKQGEKSWEWPEKQKSVFTYFLLEALSGKADMQNKGFITTSDTSNYVVNKVKQWSVEHGTLQTPTIQSEVVGEIVLVTL